MQAIKIFQKVHKCPSSQVEVHMCPYSHLSLFPSVRCTSVRFTSVRPPVVSNWVHLSNFRFRPHSSMEAERLLWEVRNEEKSVPSATRNPGCRPRPRLTRRLRPTPGAWRGSSLGSLAASRDPDPEEVEPDLTTFSYRIEKSRRGSPLKWARTIPLHRLPSSSKIWTIPVISTTTKSYAIQWQRRLVTISCSSTTFPSWICCTLSNCEYCHSLKTKWYLDS